MAAATVPANRIVRSVAPNSVFESAQSQISTAVSFNQGDLLVYKSGLIQTTTTESDMSAFLGIATVTIVSGVIKQPVVTLDSPAVSDIPGPKYGVVAKMTLQTGDTILAGGYVYAAPTVSAATVSASGTKAIGVLQSAAVTSAAAGTTIEVLLGARYPNDTLKF